MENKELVDLIVDYRVRNNLTMKKMAEKCGIAYPTLVYLENGKRTPHRTIVRKILNVIENEVL
jgi:transcriptional regulator with XRE-family HTH domain